MNFAPYQNDEPEIERAKSPPLRSPTASPKPTGASSQQPSRNISSVADRDDPWAAARAQQLPPPSQYVDDEEDAGGYQDIEDGDRRQYPYNDYIGQSALEGGGVTGVSVFATSLGSVVLLSFEHQSDYVRFHAWQGALLFSAIFLIHIIFSWTAIISWMLFAGDLLLIAYLTAGAWRNADTLDRLELPFFGRLASGFVDDE